MTYEEGKRYTAEIDGSWAPMAHMTFTTRVTTVGQEYTPFASTTVGAPADMVIDWGQNEKPLFISSGATVFSHEYQYTGDYTITIYSAQTDVTQRQIPILAFSGTGLLSVATPLLKMGTTDLKRLFEDCALLAELPQNLFDNHPNVWSFQYTFKGCKALTSLPYGLFDKNTKATNFNSCFRVCEGLRSLPYGLFANNKAAEDFRHCFRGCVNLKLNKLIFGSTETGEEDTKRFKDVTKAMDFFGCFYDVGKELNNGEGEAPTLWLYETGGKTWTTTDCFTGATSLSNYDKIPTAWGGQK